MDTIHKLIHGRRLTSRIKEMLCFSIIILMILPNIPVQAKIIFENGQSKISWKNYPYYPPGTDIVFPRDEGSHNEEYKIEWWYVNFNLTGQSTGNKYGSFVAFYQLNSTVCEKQEVRIFSISDISSETIYSNAQIGTLTASSDHLDLSFAYITNENTNMNCTETLNKYSISQNQETGLESDCTETATTCNNLDTTTCTTQSTSNQKINTDGYVNNDDDSSTTELLQYDHWYTKTNDYGLLPFQYTLIVGGNSQQDSKPMKLEVDMDCQKQPLIVGGDGFLDLGEYGFSFYYSLTKLAVIGSIEVHGIIEEVAGFAWIDHQWGNFFERNQPPYGLALTYEWFSIQLNDNREIMVADTWDRATGEKNNQSFTGGMNYFDTDGSFMLLDKYTIKSLSFWEDPTNHRIYSSKWQIIETSKSINLLVTPIFLNQVMQVQEKYPLLQEILEKIFPGACFWEGICSVTGTINGVIVSGNAYVELTHYFDNGDYTDIIPLNDNQILHNTISKDL